MTQTTCELDGRSLTVAEVVRVARDATVRVTVAPAAREALRGSRRLVEAAIASGRTIYGINTGFGKLANVRVAPDKLDQLQANLIRSHAAGVGDAAARHGGARAHAAPCQRARCVPPAVCGPSWSTRWSPCSMPASSRGCRSRGAWAPAATSRR